MKILDIATLISTFFFHGALASKAWANEQSFVVFSDRPRAQYQKAITTFQNQTGLTIEYREEPSDQLIQRIAQGERADALIVKDLYYISILAEKNLVQENAFSQSLLQNAPSPLKDRKSRWLPITYRARALAYSSQLSAEIRGIETYKDLLNSDWQGALCLRQASHPYNQTLGAQWITELGFPQALDLVKGLVSQVAAPSYPNDKAILAAIVKGDCLFGLVNHYYVVQALRDQPQLPLSFKYLKDSTGGTPLNGVSLLLPITAQNTQALDTWAQILTRPDINAEIAEIHGDFPVAGPQKAKHIPAAWGTLIPSSIPWDDVLAQFPYVKALFEAAKYE